MTGVVSPRAAFRWLPQSRWAKASLLLLVVFALLRSVLWASVQPPWLAPDEDYHWLYVNYLVEKDTVPNLSGPFYTAELFDAVNVLQQGTYLRGARTSYTGNPKAALRQLGGSREPAPPDPRQVLHPPGYYLPAALIDDALWSKVSITRLTAMRYYSAALGALTIFAAWLLAAQLLAREWQQLGAAGIASLQPILAFSASTLTNDVSVAVTLTATLACCAWMLRGPPRARQGVPLGLLLGIAVMVKATNLSLVIVIAVMLAFLWKAYPDARRELRGVVKWTIAIPAIIAGWWYVYLLIKTHSILGERGSLTASHGAHGPGLLHFPSVAWGWISQVYRSYWFDYLSYEVRTEDIWFWLPAIGIAIVAAGFVTFLVRTRGTTFSAKGAERQAVLLITLSALLLVLPPLLLDTWRGVHGLVPTTEQGRFLTPAYPALAVVAVVALRELTRRVPRAFPWVLLSAVAAAFIFYWHTWIVFCLQRFYGAAHGHWLRELFHASWDKPTFVTQDYLAVIWILAVMAFLGAVVTTFVGARRGPGAAAVHEREVMASPSAPVPAGR